MDIRFTGKKAIVTGGGRGFGRQIALKLVELGANVFVIDKIPENLADLKAQSPTINTFSVDIADWEVTRKVVQDIGEVDLLVNNAGVIEIQSFLETTKEYLYDVTTINYLAAFNIAQVVANGMVSSGRGGAIVNMGSINSKTAFTDVSAYCCSKAAIHMLSMTMALELGPSNIRVNTVGPSLVMTDMGKKGWSDPEVQAAISSKMPLRRLTEIDDVVNAVLFLLSDKAAMISGTFVPVDGAILSGVL